MDGTSPEGEGGARGARRIGEWRSRSPDISEAVSTEAEVEGEDAPEAAIKRDPASLPAVEYFQPGTNFSIGDLSITPFTTPHDAADPCGFVFESPTEAIRMAIATDLGYMPPNIKRAIEQISTCCCWNPTTTWRC